jgi:hypothetical protein
MHAAPRISSLRRLSLVKDTSMSKKIVGRGTILGFAVKCGSCDDHAIITKEFKHAALRYHGIYNLIAPT